MKHAKWIVAGLVASVLAVAGETTLAQQPSGIGDVLAQLEQLQDANFNIARQMSAMEQRAATELQSVLDEGLVPEGIQVDILQRLIGNSLTLAAMVLAPQPAPEAATGPSFTELLDRNRIGLQQAITLAGADPDFTAAVRRYENLQIQVQDMTLALANGWKRYAGILEDAQVSGTVVSGSFDPASGSWFVSEALDEAALAALREAAQPPPPVIEPPAPVAAEVVLPSSDIVPLTTTDSSVSEAAQRTAWWLLSAQDGTDAPITVEVPEPQETIAEVPPLTPSTPVIQEVLAPDAAASTAQPEGWEIALDSRGNLMARSPNLAATTDATIRSLGMECSDDGLVVFRITSPARHQGFDVAIRGAVPEPVTAIDNVISGEEALKLSNAFSLAYHSEAGRLALVPYENKEEAQFTTEGFVEARASVVSGCAALQAIATLGSGGAETAIPSATETPSAAPIPAPATDRPPAPAEPTAKSSETQQSAVEPEPARPPLAEPSSPVASEPPKPKPSGPVDLLSGDFVR